MDTVSLVVMDMAGTTVRDNHEVEHCFAQAARDTGLALSDEDVLAVQGWSKIHVFSHFWQRELGEGHAEIPGRVNASYDRFREVLEAHYQQHPVVPTAGALDLFRFLKQQGIKLALTTGFYRKVTDIILEQLGWHKHLDSQRMGNAESLIALSLSSDQVPNGRPAPDLIFRAMELLNVKSVNEVICVGDTPSDLGCGTNAKCGLTLGVTNGTHTAGQLAKYPHDALIGSVAELIPIIERIQEPAKQSA